VKLSNLLEALKPVVRDGRSEVRDPDIDIGSIHYRAQEVKPGGLFVAVPGHVADGHDFIDEALARGASAIVAEKPIKKDSIIIEVGNSRKALALISARFYENPSEKLFIIGITGTNGKTTTAFLIENLLLKAGFKVGSIGTINYRYSGKTFNSSMTTPESADLQKILSDMKKTGITHVVMEISSHAVDLNRIDCCWMDIGIYTNLSQDHLDYYGDMDCYWSSKKKFFIDHLVSGPKKGLATAVINCMDDRGRELEVALRKLPLSIISTGRSGDVMIRPGNIKYNPAGIAGDISTPSGTFDFTSPLVGGYNFENILCATGVGIALNLPFAVIKAGMENFSGVPGRLERIKNDVGRFVFVDYAHTPDALENVLFALKAVTTSRIICVFGCGGDRDKEKRPLMGEIAGKLCDLVMITSDNPRTEPPMKIIDRILHGIKKVSSCEYSPQDLKIGFGNNKGYIIEPDRQKAIQLGITASRPGDTVLIAGKGHEAYQIIGEKKLPFDDRIEAEKALTQLTVSSRQPGEP